MNILIPLNDRSPWQDNELRYCLRSIEKHLTGWEKIFIVGVLPDWINPESVVFIPAIDKQGAQNKEENIHRKIMAGIKADIGESFLFMNDDHFLSQDFEANNFPYHHKGLLSQTISTTKPKNAYIKTVRNTVSAIGDQFDYDTHCPIVYNADTYINKVNAFKFPAYGLCIKSLYCHYADVEGSFYPDCKINDEAALSSTEGRPYFSIGNKAVGNVLESFLNELYPEKSRFEV